MIINIPDTLSKRLQNELGLNKTIEERVIEILNKNIAPEENYDQKYISEGLDKIKNLLIKIPCITFISNSKTDEPFWWLKFSINISSKISWNVVQELGHILNYLSLEEKLPTSFYPVSPPPYMNGGPEEFLNWIIESSIPAVDTNIIYDYLEGRLPEGYDKEENWNIDL